MALTDDLEQSHLAAVLPGREVRSYPAVLSTEAMAMAWARQGAAHGAVVVADYQVSPRGRGGLPWSVLPGRGLGFTLIHRPALDPELEGWPYVSASMGLCDALGPATSVSWPDGVVEPNGALLASLGVYAEPGPTGTQWLTINVILAQGTPPRGALLGRTLQALEARLSAPPEEVLTDYRQRCTTLGRQVRARMIPMGPGGPEVTGQAVDILRDGALVLRTARGSRVAIRPQNLGLLEAPELPARAPDRLLGQYRTRPPDVEGNGGP